MNTAGTGARQLAVCGLVPYPLGTTPSQRFRLEQWKPWLEAQGIRVDLYPFADRRLMERLYATGGAAVSAKARAFVGAFARRMALLPKLRRYDAVVVHRAACLAGPAFIERAVALLKRPLVFDFDDAIFKLHTSSVNQSFGWLKFPGKTATLCRMASRVVVGNAYLADYARRYNACVSIVPTSIDTDRYQPRPRGASGRVVVGWTGSSTSQTHLEAFAPVLQRLVKLNDVEIRVISNRPFELAGVPATWRPWSAETEIDEIGRFDIGIMPMPHDEWSKGKCALKLLQYMALGIPAVGSAVGANVEVIRHGENGLLAATDAEWQEGLERLVGDPELRVRLGRAGRQTVEAEYSMRRCAGLFAEAVRDAVRTAP